MNDSLPAALVVTRAAVLTSCSCSCCSAVTISPVEPPNRLRMTEKEIISSLGDNLFSTADGEGKILCKRKERKIDVTLVCLQRLQ